MNKLKDDRTDEVKFQELIEITRKAMDEACVPGVSIGMIAGGKDYAAGLGMTSIAHPLPVTPETIFQIGSTTKTFTATAVMRLVEQGKLHLDDLVRKYIPDFRVADEQASEKVTIKMLLTHTAGWLGDFFPETGVDDDALARYVALMTDLPQLTPVGEIYSYNNAALALSGRIIEVVTGKTYEESLRELILAPLEMNNSFFFPAEVMIRGFSVGHIMDGENVIIADPWPIIRGGNPAGGVASDAWDQIRYMRFQMGDGTTVKGERLLSPESMRLMKTPLASMGDGNWVGLTWMVEELDSVSIFSHGGTTNGQESDFWIAPEQDVALTVLTNLDQGYKVHKVVRAWAREHFLGVVEQTPVKIALPAEKLESYCLTFTTSTGDFLDVSRQDEGIVITHRLNSKGNGGEETGGALPPMRASFLEDDRFLVLEGILENAKGEFLRKANGEIGWMRLGGRIQRRYKA